MTYLVAVCVALVNERVVELDEHLLDVEPDQRVVAVLHRDLAGKPQQALEFRRGGTVEHTRLSEVSLGISQPIQGIHNVLQELICHFFVRRVT